jgi:hypothetical protein
MKFLIHFHQLGGCDYTIGCGHRIRVIQADSMEDARTKVLKETFGIPDDPEDDEDLMPSPDLLNQVTIYEVHDLMKLDVKALLKQRETNLSERRRLAAEAKEREDFERLKKKFGA